jgi:quinol monooxygenase YgiN
MAITLLVRLRARPGAEERLAALLGQLALASRREPGCRAFDPHRSPDDAAAFLLYERYDDEDALEAHRGSEHFARLAVGELPALLDAERTRELWAPLE